MDVNAILGGVSISCAIAKLSDVGVTGCSTINLGDDERPTCRTNSTDLVAVVAAWRSLKIVRRRPVAHVEAIYGGNRLGVFLANISDPHRQTHAAETVWASRFGEFSTYLSSSSSPLRGAIHVIRSHSLRIAESNMAVMTTATPTFAHTHCCQNANPTIARVT